MKYMPNVSIIIPMFNCEKFINETLESLCKQTYQNFEVILVDDGSTDRTLSEVGRVSNTPYKLNLFEKKNGGVSSARNLGLKKATGKFIMFLDSDDSYPENYVYEMLETQMRNPNKICMSTINNIDMEGNILFKYPRKKIGKENLSKFDLLRTIVESGGYGGFVFNKVFNQEILKGNNIYFREDIHFCEDQLFLMQYIDHIEGAVISANEGYFRLIHEDSFVQSRKNNQEFNPKWETYFIVKKELENIILKQNDLKGYQKQQLLKINLISWRNEYYLLNTIALKYSYASDILIETKSDLYERKAYSIILDVDNILLGNYSLKQFIKSIINRFSGIIHITSGVLKKASKY